MLLKKITAVAVSAAFLVTGPGHLAIDAAAQSVGVGGLGAPVSVVVTPVGAVTPAVAPAGGPSLGAMPVSVGVSPTLVAPAIVVPQNVSAASPYEGRAVALPAGVAASRDLATGAKARRASQAGPKAVAPALAGAVKAVTAVQELPGVRTLQRQGADAAVGQRKAALDLTFERSTVKSDGAAEVLGAEGASVSALEPASDSRSHRTVAAERFSPRAQAGKERSGSLFAELGLGAAIATVFAAIFSPSFRNYLKRMGQVVLGWIGIGVKKAETPEVVAQRIIDQLNAAKPEYNRKVQQASTLAEKIAIQLRDEMLKVAELEDTINDLLSDKDDSNDHLATGLIQAQKNLQASVTANEEQLKIAAANLEDIKAERQRFYQEREEMLAKINAQLSRAKAAEIQKQMAELKGGFQVGDVKDSMDRLNDIVNDMEAEAKGSKDAAESNPDEIIKKAKEKVRSQEVLDEIARRKAEIAKKRQEGKDQTGSELTGGVIARLAKAIGVKGFVLAAVDGAFAAWAGLSTGWLAGLIGVGALLVPGAVVGFVGGGIIGEKVFGTSEEKTMGAMILGAVVGIGLAIAGGVVLGGMVASVTGAVTLGTVSVVGMLFMSLLTSLSKAKASAAEAGKDRTGSLVAELGIGAAVAAVLAAIFSPSFRNYMKRMGQVALGWIGIGVKKAETPEVVAQRIIDQLNAAKPEYNRKVQQASTLAEKIAIQVRDQKAKAAELEGTITALLSDDDESNDNLATGLIQSQKQLDESTSATQEQLKIAAANLEDIKAERQRFYQEREEMLAKINAQLSRAKAAEIQKQMAELKGGFQVGDVKDSMDRLNDIVNDMEAEAKGSKDAAESNPDEIIKKAKEKVRSQEVLDEIARRKAEIAKKRQEGKDGTGSAFYKDYSFQLGAIGLAVWAGYVAMMGLTAATFAVPAFIGFLAGLASYIRSGVSADGAPAYLPVWAQSLLGGAVGAVLGFGASLFTAGFLALGATAVIAGAAVPVLIHSLHKPSKDPLPVFRMLGMGVAGALVAASLPVWALGYVGRRIDARKSTDADGNPDAESAAKAAEAGKDQTGSAVAPGGTAGVILKTGGVLASLGGLGGALAGAGLGVLANVLLGAGGLFFPLFGAFIVGMNAAGASQSPLKAVDGASNLLTMAVTTAELGATFALVGALGFSGAAAPFVALVAFAPAAIATAIFIGRETRKALDSVKAQQQEAEAAAKQAQQGKDQTGSLVAELGLGAAIATVFAAIFSPSFRNYMKRMGQVVLGWIGIGVKKAETPEVVAQRIIDQLNAAKPEYNRKVQQASTLAEKLAIQVRDQKAKAAELEGTITALLSDDDESNDNLATGLIQSQKQLDESTSATQEQLKIAAANLEDIKAERQRFYQEREEMLAKINAQLSRAKAAEIQKQMAELKGGFQVGDVKDSMDRLNDIVNDMEAEAKGSKDAAESNPDEIIKKAKEKVRSQEVLDEIARRKAEIAKKRQEGKDQTGSLAELPLLAMGVGALSLVSGRKGLGMGAMTAGMMMLSPAIALILPLFYGVSSVRKAGRAPAAEQSSAYREAAGVQRAMLIGSGISLALLSLMIAGITGSFVLPAIFYAAPVLALGFSVYAGFRARKAAARDAVAAAKADDGTTPMAGFAPVLAMGAASSIFGAVGPVVLGILGGAIVGGGYAIATDKGPRGGSDIGQGFDMMFRAARVGFYALVGGLIGAVAGPLVGALL